MTPALVMLWLETSRPCQRFSCGQLDLSDCYSEKLSEDLAMVNCTFPFVVNVCDVNTRVL